MSLLKSQVLEKLSSQTIVNPEQNVSAITLRSGKELQEQRKEVSKYEIEEKEIEKEAM